MFEAAISGLNDILKIYPWAGELAGILPLSALIDFVNIPRQLHVFELAGAGPLWSWPVTPTGARLLLSDGHTQKTCCLDRYGSSVALMAIDGRYGDQYTVSNPETVRMCVASESSNRIQNDHENMAGKNLRIQNIEIVRISRVHQKGRLQPSESLLYRMLLGPRSMFSYKHLVISATGWMTMLGTIIMSGILRCYLSLMFLIVVPATGIVIFFLHGSTPRRLLIESGSEYNRLVIVAEHMNATDWTVFYGESTLVNSFLNRPLEPLGPQISGLASASLRMILRILTLSQWVLAIGSAALKDWNACFITFWVAFCIFSHSYLITPQHAVNDWMKSRASIKLECYHTQLSSRRALLNTIAALNRNTFSRDPNPKTEDMKRVMQWVDPILAQGSSRMEWERATQDAMDEALSEYTTETLASPEWQSRNGEVLSPEWNNAYDVKENYWKPFILEGIHIAAKIQIKAGIVGGEKAWKTV